MLYLIVGLLVGLSTGLHLGIYLDNISKLSKKIWDRDPEPEAKVITPKAPGYADVTDLSAIVSPKTPYQLEREEQERTRNI